MTDEDLAVLYKANLGYSHTDALRAVFNAGRDAANVAAQVVSREIAQVASAIPKVTKQEFNDASQTKRK